MPNNNEKFKEDFYAILEVDRNADVATIRIAYGIFQK